MTLVRAARHPKIPSTVLQRRIQAFDWECEGAKTRYLTHGIHRYSGKFIPQVARQAITILSKPGELILDPYCGSGTTLLEAYVLGRRSIGIDMNSIAVLVARTKCTAISWPSIERLVKVMSSVAGDIQLGQSDHPLFPSPGSELYDNIWSDARFCDEWYLKWFSKKALFQLVGIHQAIEALDNVDVQNLALTAFSDILRRCSYAHSGYPNVMYDKRRLSRPDPIPLFVERLNEFSLAVSELMGVDGLGEVPCVREGDARAIGLPGNFVDAVVTHPPYIGSVPYAEYGVLSLTWFGHDAKELDLKLTGGKRQSRDVVERFRIDYGQMISESFRVLKPGKFMFVLVGHPLVKGKRIDLSEMTCDLADKVGFEFAARTARTGMNRRANKMGDEDLLFFEKPR